MEIKTRTFSIATNDKGDTIDIQIQEPPIRTDNLTLETWGSAFVLANRLHKYINMPALQGANHASKSDVGAVLELGAGTGLVGLTAAILWHTDVMLTDLSPIVPGLAANICLNQLLLDSSGATARCGALDWATPADLTLSSELLERIPIENNPQNKARLILAADTIYSDEHPVLLAGAIRAWLAPGPDSAVFLTYPVRVAYLDEIRALWEELQIAGLIAVEEGKEDLVGAQWDDERLNEWSVWKWKVD